MSPHGLPSDHLIQLIAFPPAKETRMGKLDAFSPFLGDWVAESNNQMGPATGYRSMKPILDGS